MGQPRRASVADIPEVVRLVSTMFADLGTTTDQPWATRTGEALAGRLWTDLGVFVVDAAGSPPVLAACAVGLLHRGLPSPRRLTEHTGYVEDLVPSPDGKTLLSASWDQTARLWSVPDGNPLGSPLPHMGRVTRCAFASDNVHLATLSADLVRVWRRSDRDVTDVHPANWKGVARLSPDGRQLCWIAWDYPSMPWEGTELHIADLDRSGHVTATHKIAGGPAETIESTFNPVLREALRYSGESIIDPKWAPDGTLFFVSDRFTAQGDRWWNIHRFVEGAIEPVTRKAAEFATPP